MVVSHDRSFIDNIATSSIVFEGNGKITEYVGGYSDWLRQKAYAADSKKSAAKNSKTNGIKNNDKAKNKPSYKEQQELQALPKRIEVLEKEIHELHAQFTDPNFYQKEAAVIAEKKQKLTQLEQELEQCFQRWQELE